MKKLLTGIICTVLTVGIAACSSGGNSGDTPKEKEFIDESKIAEMYTTPADFKGKYVTLIGNVFSTPEEKDGKMVFQMWQDPKNSDHNTVVTCDKEIGVKANDYVKIVGYVGGTFEGTNMMGGKVTAPKIIAETVDIISYQEAMVPTIKTVDVNAVKENNGVTYTIQKVEFAESETRLFISIDNQSANKYTFYSFNAKLVQNGKQYEEQKNYDAKYKDISSDLLAGIKDEGIIVFPAIEQSSFQFICEGQSDDFKIERDNHTFDITVE